MTATIEDPPVAGGDSPAKARRPTTSLKLVAARGRGLVAMLLASARAAKLPTWLQPLTTVGWSVAALGAVAWVSGVLLGWDELLVLAAVCLVLTLLSVPFLFGRLATDALLEVTPERVQPGTRVMGRLLVRNGWDRHVRGLDIEVPVGLGLAHFHIPGLAGGAEHEELFSIPTRRRAVIPVGPVSSTRGDPLGIWRRAVRWGEPITVRVHPETVLLPQIGTGLLRDLEGHTTDHLSNSDVAFHTLREYTPGDDRRHVHWRSSARTGKLLVRQFVDTRRTHVVVHLELAASAYTGDDPGARAWDASRTDLPAARAFEMAASVAGSIARRAHADGQDLTLLTDRDLARGPSPVPALDLLAEVAPQASRRGESRSPRSTSVRIARNAPDASILVLVTGPHTTPAELRLVAAPVARDARIVAIRAGSEGRTAWHQHEGITLIDLNDLADLAPALLAGAR